MNSQERAVWAAAGSVMDPELGLPLSELGMLRKVEIKGEVALVSVALTISTCPMSEQIAADVSAAVARVPEITGVQVDVSVMSPEERSALTAKLRGTRPRGTFSQENLSRVILVSSGKGGVGKSTLTANIAVELARLGLSVGVIDADVHGFSIPGILGVDPAVRPTRIDDLIVPPIIHGVKVISIGMFLPPDNTVVAWRGPMLHRTLQQFLNEVYFGDVDVLLLDMPPGTGDMALSVGQLLPAAEVLVVTTPQVAAAEVAIRSGRVAQQQGQRVIGVIENMSGLLLPDGSTMRVFGEGGGQRVAHSLSAGLDQPVPLLASIPLDPLVRVEGDKGIPHAQGGVEQGPGATAIRLLAQQLQAQGRGLAGRRLPVTIRV